MRQGCTTTFIATMLLVCAAMPALAAPMDDANAAYNRQDYATAERILRPLAEQGRAGAQHLLARMYENGQGVPRNNVEAARWYRLAADRGHAGAQLYLANMYSVGDGVPRDYVQAYMWFTLSEAGGQGEFATHGRNQVADKMTAAQIAEANQRVRAWRPAGGN